MLRAAARAATTWVGMAVPACVAFAAAAGWSLGYDEAGALLHDAERYATMARQLAAGTFGSLLGRDGGLFLDPGYPLALAAWFRLFGASTKAGMMLNAALWAGSAALFAATVRRWLSPRRALAAACLFACSPALTSFAPKLFSEHLTILGLLLMVASACRVVAAGSGTPAVAAAGLAAGAATLALARANFFPLVVAAAIALAAARRRLPAAAVGLTAILVFPLHEAVQRGGRGVMAAAHQAAMVTRWPVPVALKCGAYSLSRTLGQRLFPGVAGACNPGRPAPGEPMAEINPLVASREWLAEGFGMRDAAAIALAHPGRYLLVCGVNLLGAVWIEGFYPQPLERLPEPVRTALWLLKVALSTALWVLAARGAVRGWRRAGLRPQVIAVAAPLVYVLALQANFLGAQRYFFPLIPLLYLLAAIGFTPPAAPAQGSPARRSPEPTRPPGA